jgi:acyl carrier protein
MLARHLVVEHGIRNLLLASRSGEAAAGASELARELTELGASVRIVSCDVSDRGQLSDLLNSVAEEHPLRGIVHTAGILDDGVVGSLTAERVERVLAPKADGAWHLHELTKHLDLDSFVLFSSVAGTLGGPGQGNYAAANAFLDALAAHRRAQGLPALAMAWGPWEQTTGMTSQLGDADLGRMASSGMLALSRDQGLELFDLAYGAERAQLVLARMDTAALRARARSEELPGILHGLIRRQVRDRDRAESDSDSLAARLAGAPPSERGHVVLEVLRVHTAAVLGHRSADSVDSTRTFKDLGFDSLSAVELRNRLMASSGLQLPATLVFDYPTLDALAGHLSHEMSANAEDPMRGLGVDIDELHLKLTSMSAEEAKRSGIAARLQSVLSVWADDEDATGADVADDDLESVSDDEIFELIDREFGVS